MYDLNRSGVSNFDCVTLMVQKAAVLPFLTPAFRIIFVLSVSILGGIP